MATAAAAANARARRRIIAYFYAMHAISAEDAAPYLPQRHTERRNFERMIARGILHDAGEGRYWLDVAALKADDERRRRILVPLVIVACVIIVIILTRFYQG